MKFLSVASDAKTVKGEKLGVLTGIQYLAPHNTSSHNTCPMATPGCSASCLNTAGRGQFTATQTARIARTDAFYADKNAYFAQLIKEIDSLVAQATRRGMIPAVRLNGTSDIAWEHIAFNDPYNGQIVPNIMTYFRKVAFYDYTKVARRLDTCTLPANYDLTFSYAETETNHAEAESLLQRGHRVAVVFNVKPSHKVHNELPMFTTAIGGIEYPVVDGDISDVRFNDPVGVIVGLRMKGRATKDTSGFVVNA